MIFTTEGGAKSWHGRPVRTTNQIKCLLDGCDDWDVSADLPEWDSHPSIIKENKIKASDRDPFSFHTTINHGGAKQLHTKTEWKRPTSTKERKYMT